MEGRGSFLPRLLVFPLSSIYIQHESSAPHYEYFFLYISTCSYALDAISASPLSFPHHIPQYQVSMDERKKWEPTHDCYCKSGTGSFCSGCNKNDRIIQDAFGATWQREGGGSGRGFGGGGRVSNLLAASLQRTIRVDK